MKAHLISATEMTRHLSDTLNRVHYQGQSFDIKRGGEVIAKLIPANEGNKVGMPISSLNAFFAQVPKLDSADSIQFEKDIEDIRHHLKMEGDQWDS